MQILDNFDLAQMLLKHLKELPGLHLLVTQICQKCAAYNQSNVFVAKVIDPSQRCPGFLQFLLSEAESRRVCETCRLNDYFEGVLVEMVKHD